MPFQPGVSGNAKGRPRGAKSRASREVRELAQRLFDDAWWEATRTRMLEGKESPAIVSLLLRFSFGNPDASPSTNVGVVVHTGILQSYPEDNELTAADGPRDAARLVVVNGAKGNPSH